MFEHLRDQPADSLLALIKLHREDPRPHKIDLGVGVYRDETGATPVMHSVKAAEKVLLDAQASKSYLGPEGDLAFVDRLRPIIFGAGERFGERLVGLQTPGGSGALRIGAELAAAANPTMRIWVGTPTWPNHIPVFGAGGLSIEKYPYFDITRQALLFEPMLEAFSRAAPGDLVLLHGACHNPTGADLSREQWLALRDVILERRLVPFIDFAYQGLGLGLEEDAQGLRLVLDAVEEALIAYSCDKNFGLYRDRTGALFVLARNAAEARRAQGGAAAQARVNWSMPPDHGAAVVRTVLESAALEADWRAELVAMGKRVNAMRAALAAAAPQFAFVGGQRGLFSNLALPPAAIEALRREHAVYMAPSGRINLAGLLAPDEERLAAALAEVGAVAS